MLIHPLTLAALPPELPAYTMVVGVYVADFHRAWPWSARHVRCIDISPSRRG